MRECCSCSALHSSLVLCHFQHLVLLLYGICRDLHLMPVHSSRSPCPYATQGTPSPDEAYIAAVRGQAMMYSNAGMHQQQLQHQLQQQLQHQQGRRYPDYRLQHSSPAMQGLGSAFSDAGARVQHVVQATPERHGITPMQLAMLQQQRLQQAGSNSLYASPSIHSVTSSNRSWSEDQ